MALKLKVFNKQNKTKLESIENIQLANNTSIIKNDRTIEHITIINQNKIERNTNSYLNLISDIEDKSQANIPQNEIIQKALNFSAYLINKISGESITESRQMQYAMLKLFDNLEKLSSNCDHYTNRYLIKKDRKSTKQLNRSLLKRNKAFSDSSYSRLFIPKDIISK